MRPGQNDVYSIGVGVRCLEFLVPKKSIFFPEILPLSTSQYTHNYSRPPAGSVQTPLSK